MRSTCVEESRCNYIAQKRERETTQIWVEMERENSLWTISSFFRGNCNSAFPSFSRLIHPLQRHSWRLKRKREKACLRRERDWGRGGGSIKKRGITTTIPRMACRQKTPFYSSFVSGSLHPATGGDDKRIPISRKRFFAPSPVCRGRDGGMPTPTIEIGPP